MNTCDHTKFSITWHDCASHPSSDCLVASCDNCNHDVLHEEAE